MKKYSKSDVMKMAWEIYKTQIGKRRFFSFSEALRLSWYITKRDARIDSMEKPAKVTKMTGSAKQISWAEDIKARIREGVENSAMPWERKAYEAFLDIVESVEYAGDIIDFWCDYRGTLDDRSLLLMMNERAWKTDSRRELSECLDSVLVGCRVRSRYLLKVAPYSLCGVRSEDWSSEEELAIRYCNHLSDALDLAERMYKARAEARKMRMAQGGSEIA